MTEFICPDTNKSYKIFQGNGSKQLSEKLNVPILAKIPINPNIAISTDNGTPYILNHENSTEAIEFNKKCDKI